MNEKKRKKIETAIEERITDNSIECEVAQEIAAKLGVEAQEVGEVAQGLELDLKNCQGKC
jgi:hypothetical protein